MIDSRYQEGQRLQEERKVGTFYSTLFDAHNVGRRKISDGLSPSFTASSSSDSRISLLMSWFPARANA